MPQLLRLPLTIADYATRPTRFVVGKLLDLRGSDDDQAPPATPPQASTEAAAPPQTAPKPKPAAAPKPAAKRRAPAAKGGGSARAAAQKPVRTEPSKSEVDAHRLEEHPTGPTIDVAEPWEGYDAMTEDQVLDRLTGADSGTRAAVRLYESFNGSRRQILLATEETLTQS